ncbi:MAG: alkaline shock response membrane anchor protein AmaP [Clostridia bacterium]|nr:alkaline shock response membrane anchor protein AmaP [Clostridia bacterium]
MRVKIFDRVLAAFIALVLIALLGLFAAVILDFITVNQVIDYAISLMPNLLIAKCVYGIIGVVLFLVAVKVMIGMAGSRQKETRVAPTSIHLETSDYGSTYVSLAAIDAMAQRHCRATQKVKECMTNITPCENGVMIAVKLAVSNETNIPELTASLQKSLKGYVEELSGVKVADVSILIISAASSQKTQA